MSLVCVGGLTVVLLAGVCTASAEWNKGLEAYNKKDYTTAVSEFEEVTQTNPDYAGAYYMKGLAENGLGQRSQALASLRRAVELDGAQATYKIALGQVLLQVDKYQEAYDLLKPVAASSVDAKYRSSFVLLLAQAATKTNRPQEAISALTAQTSADPRNARLFQALGSAHSANGGDRRAYAAYRQAFDLNPKDQASARNAAKAALSVARRAGSAGDKSTYYTNAAQVAERLASSAPTFEHHLLAGEAWLGAKQYSKALSWFEKAQQKQPQNALVRFYKGQCYSSMDQLDNSIRELREALKIGTSGKLRTQIYGTMGYVYDKKKDYDEAIKAYTEAGNRAKIAEMQQKKDSQEQNIQAEAERQRFVKQVAALRHQIEELEKLGGSEEEVEVLREQLVELEQHLESLK
jgi:tetratricopeptide (TPR) repeat protein